MRKWLGIAGTSWELAEIFMINWDRAIHNEHGKKDSQSVNRDTREVDLTGTV